MSKWSDEFEKQYPTVGKLREATEEYKKMTKAERDKYWIHKLKGKDRLW